MSNQTEREALLGDSYSEMSREQLERHAARLAQAIDDDKPLKFWQRHALSPKIAPSCFVCGQLPEKVALWHGDLPNIVVCAKCRDNARSASTLFDALTEAMQYVDPNSPIGAKCRAALAAHPPENAAAQEPVAHVVAGRKSGGEPVFTMWDVAWSRSLDTSGNTPLYAAPNRSARRGEEMTEDQIYSLLCTEEKLPEYEMWERWMARKIHAAILAQSQGWIERGSANRWHRRSSGGLVRQDRRRRRLQLRLLRAPTFLGSLRASEDAATVAGRNCRMQEACGRTVCQTKRTS